MKRLLLKNIIVSTIVSVRRLLPKHFQRKGVFSMLLLLFNSVLELAGLGVLIPLFLAILKDDAFENGIMAQLYAFSGVDSEQAFITMLCILIFLLTVLKNVMSLWIQRYLSDFSFSIYGYMSSALQKSFYKKGFLFFKEKNSNKLVTEINAMLSFAQSVILATLNFLTESFVIILILVGILLYDYRALLLLVLFVGPVFFLFYRAVRRRIAVLGKDVVRYQTATSKDLYQSIFGYVDVIINNNEKWFFNQYQKNVGKLAKTRVQLHVFNQAPTKVIETTMIFAILVMIMYGMFVLEDKEKLIMLLAVFALAAYRIMPSINRLMMALMSIKSYNYTIGILDQLEVGREELFGSDPISFEDKVLLEDFSYVYPNTTKPVLDKIDLQINKGETLGIIGKSGSGKTTLINLLLGLLEPNGGKIMVDGTPLSEKNLKSWRNRVGYVQQDVFLVDGTLAENIALGFDQVDHEKVQKVAKQASLEGLIAELSDGLNTSVGERGASISGGQRQRVGIARALYSGAEVLFFDEATSALDTETESEITEAIHSLSNGELTMIIIAHRHSTLKYCNRIVELEKGRIKENPEVSL